MGQTHAEREVEIGRKFLDAGDPNSASYHFLAAVEIEPEKAEHHFWLGSSYCAEEKFRDAEKPLRDALRIEPNYAEALKLLGKCAMASGHLASAEHYFQLARDLEEETTDPIVEGRLLHEQGRFVEAESCFREAVRLNPDDEVNHYWLGVALHDQGRFVEAESCFREAVRLNPDDEVNHYWLGSSLHKQERFVEAESCFREAVRLNPDDEVNHHWLGVALRDQGRFVEAETFFREALRLNPEDPTNHFWQGMSLRDLEFPISSEFYFRETTRLDPENALGHYFLGLALHYQGRFADAETSFRESVRFNPEDAASHYWLGILLHECEHFEDAETYFREAVRLDPKNDQYRIGLSEYLKIICPEQQSELEHEDLSKGTEHFNMGVSLYSQGRFLNAEACFREAVRLNTENDVYHFGLGQSLFKQGRFVDAEASFRRASALNPKNSNHEYWIGNSVSEILKSKEVEQTDGTYFETGKSLYDSKFFDEAEVCFREAIQLNPEKDLHHSWLGRSIYSQDRFDEAEACFREAVRINPENDEHYSWLGRSLYDQNLLVEAETAFRSAIRLEPGIKSHRFWLEKVEDRITHENKLKPGALKVSASLPDAQSMGLFTAFLKQGKFWLENSVWQMPEKSTLLQNLSYAKATWANPASHIFKNYEVPDEFLDESLARAELLSKGIRLQPRMPIYFETPELSIAMTIEGVFLRAWVGVMQCGVGVSINLKNWKLYYPLDNSDGAFAAGAALNWFLDRSLAHVSHPHFSRAEGDTWGATSGFYDDIEKIFTGRYSQPPVAHRVRGHIRTLIEREPTDESRDNAPSYIRRHMGPSDTWVRAHNRGEEESSKRLATRLEKFSNLADFLATVPRA